MWSMALIIVSPYEHDVQIFMDLITRHDFEPVTEYGFWYESSFFGVFELFVPLSSARSAILFLIFKFGVTILIHITLLSIDRVLKN